MTATHVQKSTYERAWLVVQIINTNTLTYTGTNGSIWPSSLSFIPSLLTGEKFWGDCDTQEGISEILMLRLEYYLTEILSFPLPPDILADFLSWLPPHVKTPKRNIWGRDLGTPDLSKRSSFTGTLMNTSVKGNRSHTRAHTSTCTYTQIMSCSLAFSPSLKHTHKHVKATFRHWIQAPQAHRTESCHIRIVMSHVWISRVSHMNLFFLTYESVTAHTGMSIVSQMNESLFRYEAVVSHIWMSHVCGQSKWAS